MIDIQVDPGRDTGSPIRSIGSWDCQTFLLVNDYEQFIWDGTALYRYPFVFLSHLDESDIFLGAEPPVDESGDWTLHRWRNGQILQSIVLPQSNRLTQPNFVAYPLNPQTLLVTIGNSGGLSDIARWDMATNQLHVITGNYGVRNVNGGLGFQVFGSDTDQRVAWCSGLATENTNTIYQWEARTNTVTPIQTNALCDLRSMSDGSLIGRTIPEQNKASVFFRWDGQTVHLFPRNDQVGIPTFIYSDWMTLE
jgi:hypothetical protein